METLEKDDLLQQDAMRLESGGQQAHSTTSLCLQIPWNPFERICTFYQCMCGVRISVKPFVDVFTDLSHISGGPLRRHDPMLHTEIAESASFTHANVTYRSISSVLEIQVAHLRAVNTVAPSILGAVLVRAATLSSHTPPIS
jgi:hypothetical protein